MCTAAVTTQVVTATIYWRRRGLAVHDVVTTSWPHDVEAQMCTTSRPSCARRRDDIVTSRRRGADVHDVVTWRRRGLDVHDIMTWSVWSADASSLHALWQAWCAVAQRPERPPDDPAPRAPACLSVPTLPIPHTHTSVMSHLDLFNLPTNCRLNFSSHLVCIST